MENNENKRYYWLKLKEDFFRSKAIKKLRRQKNGELLTLIYLKMQLMSLKHNGMLFFEGFEEDFTDELALDLDEEEEPVRETVAFLTAQGLLVQKEADSYFLTAVPDVTGSESFSAERMRRQRSKQKMSQCDADVQNSDRIVQLSDEEIEKEIEIEKETERIEKIKEKINEMKKTTIQDNAEEECKVPETPQSFLYAAKPFKVTDPRRDLNRILRERSG